MTADIINNLACCNMAFDDTESIKVLLPNLTFNTGKKEFILKLENLGYKVKYPFLIVSANNDKSEITYKKGNLFPNSQLGDLKHKLNIGLNIIKIHDFSRFETKEGTIKLETNENFQGLIGYYIQ